MVLPTPGGWGPGPGDPRGYDIGVEGNEERKQGEVGGVIWGRFRVDVRVDAVVGKKGWVKEK